MTVASTWLTVTMTPSRSTLAQSVAALVRIPSVNPLQTGPLAEEAGPVGERAIAEHLTARFWEAGANEVVVHEVVGERPNVYAIFPGRTKRLVVLDVHTDTVSVEHMTDPPFDGRIENDAVWGRGALDTKASLGVILALLDSWKAARMIPEPTLMVVASMSEEDGGLLGAAAFREWADNIGLDIDELVIAEPTDLAPLHGHKGALAIEVTIEGTAAHSALPQLGENAIVAAADVIAAFDAENERLSTLVPETALGHATISVTKIEGGTGTNVIPASCSFVTNCRLVPDEKVETLYERLGALAASACELPVTVKPLLKPGADGRPGLDAFYQGADSPLVAKLSAWTGNAPTVAPFGTNALRYSGFARQTVVFGPGCIDDAHGATEHIKVDALVALAEIYERWLSPGHEA